MLGTFFSRNILSATILIVSVNGALVNTAYADGGIYINDGTDVGCLYTADSTLLFAGLTKPLAPLINGLAIPIGNTNSIVNSLTGSPLLIGLGLGSNLPSSATITSNVTTATSGSSLINTAASASVLTSSSSPNCLSNGGWSV
ncbi:MAG: hypothetical protein H7Z73_05760 [Candidatus Saccharibacteria bacterium]|nr:hypothetical protein [Moraxellaceae bacterium]